MAKEVKVQPTPKQPTQEITSASVAGAALNRSSSVFCPTEASGDVHHYMRRRLRFCNRLSSSQTPSTCDCSLVTFDLEAGRPKAPDSTPDDLSQTATGFGPELEPL